MKKFKDVDSYLAALPAEQRKALKALRKTIKSVVPKAVEKISYGMPAFSQGGMLAYYAGFKDHLSLFMPDLSIMKKHNRELKAFETTKGGIHFSPERPIPAGLVKKLIKARLEKIKTKKLY